MFTISNFLSELMKQCHSEFYFRREQLIDLIQALQAKKIVDRQKAIYWIVRTTFDPYVRFELCPNRWDSHKQAGFISIKWEDNNSIYICDVQVYVQFQGLGLGSRLLTEAINYGRHRGAISISGIVVWDDLHRTPFLLDWYESKGFTVKRHSQESGNHAAHLHLQLRTDLHPKFGHQNSR